MMRRTRSLLAAGSGVVLSVAVSACSDHSRAAFPGDEAVIPVTVAIVTMADVADTFEAGGVVQARTTATIMARILAQVRDVRVAPGDRVRAGQLLIVLDGSDLSAQARSAQAAALAASHSVIAAASEHEAAEAALTLARAMHARMAGLHAKRSATAQELDEATSVLRAAEARAAGAAAKVQAAESALESARAASEAASATESFVRITAPFDGIVAEKLVEPGNMAAPGTPLIRLEDTRGFRLDVRVDQSRIDQMAVGAAVPVSLDSGTGGATTTVNGTVAEISRAVEADARAFLVKITLPDAAGLRSGLFGRARFGGAARRALTVPAAALARHGQVTSVFVVEKGIARLRLVHVNGTEVLAGLSDGEVVIVAAPPAVTDGRRVTEGGR
jgi:multidrug efflux pump subunit AcrA (membrane-fusion protein)